VPTAGARVAEVDEVDAAGLRITDSGPIAMRGFFAGSSQRSRARIRSRVTLTHPAVAPPSEPPMTCRKIPPPARVSTPRAAAGRAVVLIGSTGLL
jgi:hypothetical protein